MWGDSKRPTLVWLIAWCYFVGVGLGVVSSGFALLGPFPLMDAAHQWLLSLSLFELCAMVSIWVSNVVGSLLLFVGQKRCLYWFVTAFMVDLLVIAYQAFEGKLVGALEVSGVVHVSIAKVWSICVIGYIYWLGRKRIKSTE